MSKTHKILILIVLTLTSGFIATESMLIIPGKSVGAIIINKSTKQDIQKQFGKGKIITETVGFCGMSHKYKTQLLVLSEIGLVLSFKTDKPKANDTVNYIRVYSKCDCITNENIKVGLTTRAEICKIYGARPIGASQYKFSYNDIGIGFEFENSKVGDESGLDTLTGINIFEPRPN
jgi:hypothetical protein